MSLSKFLLASLVLVTAACAPAPSRIPAAESAAPQPLDVSRDYHSYANTTEFRTQHLVLDLAVDFSRRVLEGAVELRLQRLSASAGELVLDTRDLDIAQVEAATGEGAWTPAAFKLDRRDEKLGSALRIALPPAADRVRVRYATRPEASGLQWVTPAQTAGKKHPFLYTQSQAIHARSWIPLQDTPMVRSTYEARVRTPKNLLAVMSAINRPETRRDGDYAFRMPQPVPSYLIALAVGDLKFRPIGARTGMYAEPSMLRAAAREFEDTERMVDVVERMFGPYRWQRYDMLVLPPSFPYGGMENPRLTFLTPTAIVGDKSGVSLIAHELAHSWSGNLVTNATWRDFWLNEGTTTYLTYRIMDELYGADRGNMERVLGQQELAVDFGLVAREGDKALAYDQRGRDPDEVFSQVPYEKGSLFFAYLENQFGRERFDAFLRGWFDDHAFQSRTTEDFLAYLDAKLLKPTPGLVTAEKIQEWVYGAAMPADTVYAQSDAFANVDAQRAAWLEGRIPVTGLRTKRWTRHEWQHFLDNMPAPLSVEQARALDRRFKLTQEKNAYIATSWFEVAIAAGYEPAFPAIERFLTSVGRMKFLNPLYRALARTEPGLAFARRVYAQARSGYHPIGQASVERILAEGEKAAK